MIDTSAPSHRGRPLRAAWNVLLAGLLAAGASGAPAARQFEGPPPESSATPEGLQAERPTVEAILEAHRAGRTPAEIVAWIEGTGASFDLDVEGVLRLRAQGVPPEVVAAMARLPEERLRGLTTEGASPPEAGARREGLSKRRLLKMIRDGAPEEEILDAILEEGSSATLSLDEAIALREKGVSAALLTAMVTGAVPAPPGVAPQAPTIPAQTPPAAVEPPPAAPPEEEAPLIDDIVGEEEDEAEEEVPEAEEAPLLDEIGEEPPQAPAGARARFTVLSAPAGARLWTAPAGLRPERILAQARSAGRSPGQLRLDPGSHVLLVEKPLDDFDEEIVPAVRTVHDGAGGTRTLVEQGDVYYDVGRCCVPRGLGGDLVVSRIGEDQQGTILGDEFEGLPPYLWDGNRYLILSIRGGRLVRVIKAYEVRQAAGEPRTLVATFVPSSRDPLAASPSPAEARGRIEEEARAIWEPPTFLDLEGIGRIHGIPAEDLSRIGPALATTGKALWKRETEDGNLTILALSLDTLGRTRIDEVRLRREGAHGAFSTPSPPPPRKKKSKARVEAPPEPLPAVTRSADPGADLPVLTVENEADSAALVRLGDGTVIYVSPGASREVTIGPGTFDLEARFEDRPLERRSGKAHFTYHTRYTLRLS